MKKKNGVNLMLFIIITLLFPNFSCKGPSGTDYQGVLLKTDSEFSAMSEKEGMFRAFLSYIDTGGVILRDKSYPLKGRQALEALYAGRSDTSFTLSWTPEFEMISLSGDLGYTYGLWTNTNKTTGEVSRGTYTTFWKKQDDGSWKFVLDTGTQDLTAEGGQ